MKTHTVILGLLISVLAGSVQAESFNTYQAAYQDGLEKIQQGKMQSASESFLQAISLFPKPFAEPDEYLPYINLSISLFELGKTRAARDALIQSQVFGVAPSTETGRLLLDRYASEIMSAPLDDSHLALLPPNTDAVSESPSQSVKSPSQSDTTYAYQKMEAAPDTDKAFRRCLSTISEDNDNLPWYFYYQCGVELMKAGDARQAITAFEMGANALEDPRRGKRMYGMWFVDYLPYYQMALAYSQLGNWERANAAIESSEDYGEFTPSDPDYASFSALDRLIKSNLKRNDS